jgi:hypothetical protein
MLSPFSRDPVRVLEKRITMNLRPFSSCLTIGTLSIIPKSFVGLCAEFPSLSWLEASPEAALTGIRSLVKKVVADLKRNQEAVPEPISARSYSGKFMVRVPSEVH